MDISIGSDTNEVVVPNCSVAYISNHAQESTNTFPFFVYLNNEVTNPSAAESTPRYLAWKWKPGQLGHIKIPNKNFEQMIVVPRDAIAEDGVSKFVFKWNGEVMHDHGEEEEEDPDHEHPDEYEPLEVNVVFMDQKFAVIDPTGRLKPGRKSRSTTRISYYLPCNREADTAIRILIDSLHSTTCFFPHFKSRS